MQQHIVVVVEFIMIFRESVQACNWGTAREERNGISASEAEEKEAKSVTFLAPILVMKLQLPIRTMMARSSRFRKSGPNIRANPCYPSP